MKSTQAQKRFFPNNNGFEHGIFYSMDHDYLNSSRYDADLIQISNVPRVPHWPNMQGFYENVRLWDMDAQSLQSRRQRA